MKIKTDKRAFLFCALAFASYYVIVLCAIGYATVFLRSAGVSEAGTGTIVATACIVAALLQPVLGRISDKVKGVDWKRLSIALGLLLLVSFVFVYFSKNALLVASFFAVIIFTNCTSPFLNESSFYYERNGRHVNFGIVRGAGSISYALISYLFQFAEIGNDTHPIIFTGIAASLVLIASVIALPRVENVSDSDGASVNGSVADDGVSSAGDDIPATDSAAVDEATSESIEKSRSFVGFVKEHRVFMIFWLSLIFIMTFQSLFSANLIDIVNKANGSVDTMGIAIALAAIVEIPVMFLFSKLLKKMSPELLILVGAFFFVVKSVLFLIAGSMTVVYIAQVLQMLTYAVVVPASVYLSDKLVEKEYASTGQTLIGFTVTSGSVFGFFIGGITEQYGGTTVMLLTGVVITVIGFIIALIANLAAKGAKKLGNGETLKNDSL